MNNGYTGIVLDDLNRKHLQRLAEAAKQFLKDFLDIDVSTWETKGHHMTLHLGPPTELEKELIGFAFIITVDAIGFNATTAAYRVSDVHKAQTLPMVKYPVEHKSPHITMLVNRGAGGKPKDANTINNWVLLPEPMTLIGHLQHVI